MDLGTLGGVNSTGYAINNAGQVVGDAERFAGASSSHALLYTSGRITDIGTLDGVSAQSRATGINDNGQVTGWSGTLPNNSVIHSFIYTNGQMVDIGTLGGINSQAMGINNAGEVTADPKHPQVLITHSFTGTVR
jgi:probable HAF family extracellular repeat protein